MTRIVEFPEKTRLLSCQCGVKEFHIRIGSDNKPHGYECIKCETVIWIKEATDD